MGTSIKTENVLLIPGMPTLRKSIIPPIAVQLPIEARCSRGKYLFMGILWLLCALAMAALALTFFVGDLQNQRSLAEKMVMAGFQLFGLYWAPFLLTAALLAFLDAWRVKPALIVGSDRLVDNRSGLSVRWADILSARPIMTRAGYWGVTLRMHDSALLPRSLRLGYPLLSRRSDEAHIQCNLLSVPSYQIANSIFTLAQRGGAQLLPPRSVLFSNTPPPTVLKSSNSNPSRTPEAGVTARLQAIATPQARSA